ncbi:hypothetical protein B0H16DRAFT_1477494 [Mycena metata]|uniref:Uncharacterized protein n=1 Tax=Mycena metata TaxID=1033252 RepID=A0AAD7H904_9AGAR|nr:hypothetical protein B0H16DRAFT_1477494 [Mycena metata]
MIRSAFTVTIHNSPPKLELVLCRPNRSRKTYFLADFCVSNFASSTRLTFASSLADKSAVFIVQHLPFCSRWHTYRRIDPYAPRESPPTPAEILEQEEDRLAHNARICALRKYAAVKLHASITNARARFEATEETLAEVETQTILYEQLYGKFIPDAQNPAWFARKAARIADLVLLRQKATRGVPLRYDHPDMVRYLTAGASELYLGSFYVANALAEDAFEEDFGHPFSHSDGLDIEFDRMASHRSSAAWLFKTFSDDPVGLATYASKPLVFQIDNPYPEDNTRRKRFDLMLRQLKLLVEGPRGSETLPANVVDPFPFSLTNPWQNLEQWRLCGYYDACFIREKISNLALYHWEALHDQLSVLMNPQTPPTAEANPAVAERTALRLSVGEKFALPGKFLENYRGDVQTSIDYVCRYRTTCRGHQDGDDLPDLVVVPCNHVLSYDAACQFSAHVVERVDDQHGTAVVEGDDEVPDLIDQGEYIAKEDECTIVGKPSAK